MKPHLKKNPGTTLLELIIALSIFALFFAWLIQLFLTTTNNGFQIITNQQSINKDVSKILNRYNQYVENNEFSEGSIGESAAEVSKNEGYYLISSGELQLRVNSYE